MPLQVEKIGKTIAGSFKIEFLTYLKESVLGMALDFVLWSFWHQVDAKLSPKVNSEGSSRGAKREGGRLTPVLPFELNNTNSQTAYSLPQTPDWQMADHSGR